MKNLMSELFKRDVTKDQSRDTGMAMVLLLLILSIILKRKDFVSGAIIALVVNMIAPLVYWPVAVVWLGFSHLLGTITSRILLTIVFLVVVTPIGLVRKMFGRDALNLKAFKGSEESAMICRNHKFVGEDIENPY